MGRCTIREKEFVDAGVPWERLAYLQDVGFEDLNSSLCQPVCRRMSWCCSQVPYPSVEAKHAETLTGECCTVVCDQHRRQTMSGQDSVEGVHRSSRRGGRNQLHLEPL